MKRNLAAVLCVAMGAVGGCSLPLWLIPDSDESFAEGPEVGPFRDTGLRPRSDTGSLFDTRPPATDTRPVVVGCASPLAPTFACEPAAAKAGENVCTDAMLVDIVDACFGASASASTCAAVRLKHPVCEACALKKWIYFLPESGSGHLDTGACLRAIAPDSGCANAWRCTMDCVDSVCVECADEGGEFTDCKRDATAAAGVCSDLAAADLTKCEADPSLSVCFVSKLTDVLPFLRGACRDGGAWDAGSTDAGTADGG